jgi:hypothetical protein
VTGDGVDVLRHACCGSCYEGNYECLEPGLAALVLTTTATQCLHEPGQGFACRSCAPLLQRISEGIPVRQDRVRQAGDLLPFARGGIG